MYTEALGTCLLVYRYFSIIIVIIMIIVILTVPIPIPYLCCYYYDYYNCHNDEGVSSVAIIFQTLLLFLSCYLIL